MLDEDGSGAVTTAELSKRMDCRRHPDVLAGKKAPEQILQELIGRFEANKTKKADGEIDLAEFLDYYEGVSPSIPLDLFFVDMLKRQWNVSF